VEPTPGAYPWRESLLATHIEPAEPAPLVELGNIEVSLLPSPFGPRRLGPLAGISEPDAKVLDQIYRHALLRRIPPVES
jgi:hypothetical protein